MGLPKRKFGRQSSQAPGVVSNVFPHNATSGHKFHPTILKGPLQLELGWGLQSLLCTAPHSCNCHHWERPTRFRCQMIVGNVKEAVAQEEIMGVVNCWVTLWCIMNVCRGQSQSVEKHAQSFAILTISTEKGTQKPK